jgi:uncharacterized membrane protein
MDDERLRRELDQLRARLARVESALGVTQPAEPPPDVPAAPPVASVAPEILPVARVEPEEPARPEEPPATSRESAIPDWLGTSPSAQPPPPRTPLELLIGAKWAAWGGAIVVVLAVGFFVKLAVDEGWWGGLSELTRCLLAAGETALRKVGRPAAVGLFSAGLGTLYLTAFATFRYFDLLEEGGAFVLMAFVALLGFAITLRARMTATGVLSVLGGYLAPILLSEASAHPAVLPMYLTMLLGISLGCSAAIVKPFRTLRYVALACHLILGLLWALNEGWKHEFTAMVFMSVWWAMIAAEALYAARREQSTLGNAVATLLFTAWYVSVGCAILVAARLEETGRDWTGLFTVLVAGLSACVVSYFGTGLAALRQRPRSAIEKLSVSLWAQAGVLLAVAIALQFDGYGRTIGWLAVGLASVELGRRLRSRGVDAFGLIVGLLALIRVVGFDTQLEALRTELWALDAVRVTHWSILALIAIVAVHTVARRLRVENWREWDNLVPVLAGLGVLAWMGLCVTQCRDLTITGGWLIGCVLLLALERLGRPQRYFEIGLLLLVATAAKWLIVDAIARRFAPAWDPSAVWPLLNWQMGLAAAIAATGWWAARLLLRRADEKQATLSAAWQAAFVVASLIVLVGVSFEADRLVGTWLAGGHTFTWPAGQLRHLMITMVWSFGALGVGLFAAALRTRREDGALQMPEVLSRFGWVLLAACGVKWVLCDTLFYALSIEAQPQAWFMFNVQMFAGIVVAGGGLLLSSFTARENATALWIPVMASVLLLWGLSFELERAIASYEATAEALWSPLHLRALWWTLLWAAGGLAMLLYGRLRPWRSMVAGGWSVLILAGITWLTFDTIAYRIEAGVVPASVLLNLQFAVGALVAVMLGLMVWRTSLLRDRSGVEPGRRFDAPRIAAVLVAAIGLWSGSLELDRFFAGAGESFMRAEMALQTSLSTYWGLFGMGLVALGFLRRAAWCRYAGLGLLAVTLGKVLIKDMSDVQYVYRVLSLLGVGLLLVITSVAYSKFAPRILASTRLGSGEQAD